MSDARRETNLISRQGSNLGPVTGAPLSDGLRGRPRAADRLNLNRVMPAKGVI
jgi:hypothetical protein